MSPQVHFADTSGQFAGTSGNYAGFGAPSATIPGPFAMPIALNGPSSKETTVGQVPVSTGFSGSHIQANTSSVTHPWYFDCGATNHITNNLNNIEQSQIAHNCRDP